MEHFNCIKLIPSRLQSIDSPANPRIPAIPAIRAIQGLYTWLEAVEAAALLFLFHLLMYSMGISIWISCTSSPAKDLALSRSRSLSGCCPGAARGPPRRDPPAASRCCCWAMGVSSASSLYYKLSTIWDWRRCEGVVELR